MDNRLHHTKNAWDAYCEHNELTTNFRGFPHHTRYWIPSAILREHFEEYCWEFGHVYLPHTFLKLLRSLYTPVRRIWNGRSGVHGFAGIKQSGLTVTSYGKAAAKSMPGYETEDKIFEELGFDA